eukprot:gene16048-24575_t
MTTNLTLPPFKIVYEDKNVDYDGTAVALLVLGIVFMVVACVLWAVGLSFDHKSTLLRQALMKRGISHNRTSWHAMSSMADPELSGFSATAKSVVDTIKATPPRPASANERDAARLSMLGGSNSGVFPITNSSDTPVPL